MRRIVEVAALALIIGAGVAFAKQGVKDPGVKQRMETMDAMALNLKLLANMAAGKMDFSAADAAAAKAAVLAAAKQVPEVFKVHHADPASDALPVIWTQWDDFTKRADTNRMAVELIDTDTQDGLQTSLGGLAKTCKSCHETYRQ